MAKNGKPGRAEDVDKTPLEDVSKDTVNSYSILLCTLLWQNKHYHLLDFSQIFLTFADDPEVLKDVPEDHCRLPLHCLLHLHMIVDRGLWITIFLLFTPSEPSPSPSSGSWKQTTWEFSWPARTRSLTLSTGSRSMSLCLSLRRYNINHWQSQPWASKISKFHNVFVTDGPPAKWIEKIERLWKGKLLSSLTIFLFQSCLIFLAGRPSITDTSFHISEFLPSRFLCRCVSDSGEGALERSKSNKKQTDCCFSCNMLVTLLLVRSDSETKTNRSLPAPATSVTQLLQI